MNFVAEVLRDLGNYAFTCSTNGRIPVSPFTLFFL